MSPDETEFVDRLGLFFERLGGPRTMGRIYGWLLISEPQQQSLTALAATLGVSKASVSTVIRLTQEGGLVERLPASTRQHHYRVTPGGFTQVLQAQFARMRAGVEAAEFGLSVVSPDRPEQRARLEDLRDFCEFSAREAPDAFMRRGEEYREAKGATRR
jgi:DNA-binding transcriptional regulator GbsR (MarR family)